MAGEDGEQRLTLRPGAAAWQQVDGETILLDISASKYLGINSSGSVLWSALAEGATRGRLARLLVERFELTEQQARADVEAFIADCRDRDLLEP